jgi:hypothetical protein
MNVARATGFLIFGLNIIWGLYWVALIFWWEFGSIPDKSYYLQVVRYAGAHPYSCFVITWVLLNPVPVIHYLLIFFAAVPLIIDLISVLDIMLQTPTIDLTLPSGQAALALVWSAFGLSILVVIWIVTIVVNQYCKLGINCFGDRRLDGLEKKYSSSQWRVQMK